MTRLPPISDKDWPRAIEDLRDGFAGALNVYRVMVHHLPLLRAWSDLREHVVRRSALSPAQSEVVILRTGWRRGSTYEWAHHVVRALDCGLPRDRILTVKGALEGMEPADRLLAGAVDELIDNNRLSDRLQQSLVETLGIPGMMDLIATVGFYTTLAYLLNSFDPPVDAAIADRYRQVIGRQAPATGPPKAG